MSKKEKIYVTLEKDMKNDMIRFVKGYRGLSSKKRRIQNKKISQVISDVLEEYLQTMTLSSWGTCEKK